MNIKNPLYNGYRNPSAPQSGRGVELTTHLKIMPRLGMNGVVALLPHTPPWNATDITSLSLYFLATTQRC